MLRRIVTITAQRCRHLSNKVNVVKSRFPDVHIPNLRVDEYIFHNVKKWAGKTALECLETGRKITYHQLEQQSVSLARFLRGPLGLSKGDTIAVILKNVPEYAVIVLGGSIAGLKVTTINPLYTSEEIKRQLVSSDSKLLFTLPELWGTVTTGINAIPQKNIPVVVIKHKSNDVTPTGSISFSEVLENHSEASLDHIHLSDTFLLPYSSGTTGLPKGVALTHNSLVANFCQTFHADLKVNIDTDANHQDVIPIFLPMFHLYGLAIIMLGMLSQGCKLVTFPKYGTQALIQFCEQHKPTIIHAVPPIVLAITENPAIQPKHLQTIRTIISGAAPLGAADVERFHRKAANKIDLIQLYGLTETSPVVTIQSGKVSGGIKIGGSGLLVPNAECKVVPVNETSHPGLEANERGELLFRGPQNMKGYHNNEQATQETLVGDGWLKTGDIGYYDEDGHFFITDRLKELIKVKGFQVAPAELEEILRDHPCVADAAVVGVPDHVSGEAPKAFIVLKSNKKTTKKDLDEYVSSKVTDYKRLKGGVVFLDSIPKTASGKILRRQLKLM